MGTNEENNVEETNQNENQKKVNTGNVLVDIGLTIVVAIGSAVVGTVAHRVSELRSRKKAKTIAMQKNNKGEEE